MALQDFVNREHQLEVIWDSIVNPNSFQLILISGASGIGKSYLLQECQELCRKASIPHCSLNFAHSRLQDYLEVIHSVRRQLDYDKFTALTQTLAEVRSRSEPNHRLMPVPSSHLESVIDTQSVAQAGRSGGIDFKEVTATARDIVGRDINYVIQIIQQDDPFVRAEIRERITASWKSCLQELTVAQSLVCFIDSWENATVDVSDWIQEAILNAMFDGQLGRLVVVLAGQTIPRLPRLPGRIHQVTLDALSEDAVQTYWVERRKLGAQEWEHVFRLTRGYPYMVAAIADLQSLSVQTV